MKLHSGEKTMNIIIKGLGLLILGGLYAAGRTGGANINLVNFNSLEPGDQSLVAVYIMNEWVSLHKMKESAKGQSLNISLAAANPQTINFSDLIKSGLPNNVFSAGIDVSAVPITGAMLSQPNGS